MQTVEFPCPTCRNLLQVPADKAGKQAKCPQCSTLATIPTVSAIPSAIEPARAASSLPRASRIPDADLDDDDDELDELDPKAAARARRRQWWWCQLALIVAFSGGCVVVVALLLEQIAHLILTVYTINGLSGTIRIDSDPFKAVRIIVRISRPLMFLGAFGCFVGYCLNFLGPRKIAPLALTGAAVFVGGLNLILALIFRIYYSFDVRDELFGLPVWMHPRAGVVAYDRTFGASSTELVFHRVMVNLFFAMEWVVVGFLLWVLLRAMRKKRLAPPVLGVTIAAVVFGVVQMIIQLVMTFLTPESESGNKAVTWTYLITQWIGFFFQVAVVAALLVQMLRVRSAADDLT
jgi:hypothetical protein